MNELTVNDSELADVLDVLPMLRDKSVVDFVNSVHVANDHLSVQRSRTGLSARIFDSFTGESNARQTEVSAHLVQGLESSLEWLQSLDQSLAQTNYAVTCVNERVNGLKHDMSQLVNFSVDTRKLFNDFSENVNTRFSKVEENIAQISLLQQANLNLDVVFSRWESGLYRHLSLAGRVFVTLESLWWGCFGDYLRCTTDEKNKDKLMQLVHNKLRKQLQADAQIDAYDVRLPASIWLDAPKQTKNDLLLEGLNYLGDFSEKSTTPFVFSITQSPETLPLYMPRIFSAKRLGEAMTTEVLRRASYV